MSVNCFFIKRNGKVSAYLRRYSVLSADGVEAHKYVSRGETFYDYHNNSSFLYKVYDVTYDADGYPHWEIPLLDHADPLWDNVSKCEKCDYQFKDIDAYQMFADQQYEDDNGNTYIMRKPVPGMMWDAFYLRGGIEPKPMHRDCGPDGLALHVICPDGGQWHIDGRASNCTSPCLVCHIPYHSHKPADKHQYQDSYPDHRCWVRTGVPPNITVGKGGNTCQAGAGSIVSIGGKYHGFLQNGQFTPNL